MSQAVITVLMVAGALLALRLLIAAVSEARSKGDLDASAVLALALGWVVSVPTVVVVVFGQHQYQMDISRELVPVLPGWYYEAAYLSLAAATALAGVVFARQLILKRGRTKVHAAGLFALLLWAVAWLASGLQGGPLLSLSGITLLACLLAATVLPRGRGASLGVGIFGVTLAAASGLLAAVDFELASVPCRHECVLGSALTGVLPNENLLGTALVAAIPFTYLGFRGSARTWLTIYVAAMAFTTGSRGAMLAAAVIVVVLLVLRPDVDARRRSPIRTVVAGLLLAAIVLTSGYIAQHDWGSDAESLSGRAELWSVARDYVGQSPLFGYGPDRWETLHTETSEIPREGVHHIHNQWLDVAFIAGFVGIGLLAAMMAAMVGSAGYTRPAVLLALATIFMIGIGERAWSIGTADFVTFSLVALILLGPPERRREAERLVPVAPAVRSRPSAMVSRQPTVDGGL